MTKQQIKILKYLYNGPQTLGNICYRSGIPQNTSDIKFRRAFGDEFYNYVDFLKNDKHFKSIVRINNAGISCVENARERKLYHLIVIILSIISIIVTIIFAS